ncbi:hypothetical protein OAL15_01210 [Flavobacteriales bacterium]|nr:hypothetical protein [Flavobacteriales bacterium]
MTFISKIKAFLFGGSSIEETQLKPEEEEKTLEELYPDMSKEEIYEYRMQIHKYLDTRQYHNLTRRVKNHTLTK